jgi:SAM-dependent methyltransferase
MKICQKVACYITQGERLLVFDHTQYPEAGVQIPAGSLEAGESPQAAALREAREESGLQNLAMRAYLGKKSYDLSPLGRAEIHERHYFHLECLEATPERWLSYEQTPSDGSPGPIELVFYWVRCPAEAPPLSGWLDDYFPQLEATMNPTSLLDIVHRPPNPTPWSEGDNIPWHDPGFSARMLTEHLSQEHDAASRRAEKIDRQVAWIHDHALGGQPRALLDLGCGPGLYASRLAHLGHRVAGIDYSPASVAYARATARRENLPCSYQEADLRQVDFGAGYGAVLFIYGEPNVFKPADLRLILQKAWGALDPGGVLILEPHTFEAIPNLAAHATEWYSQPSGLFSPAPHLVLQENSWQAETQTTTIRYYVIDAASQNVIRYAQTMQAYTQAQYTALLEECGFSDIRFYDSLLGAPDPDQPALLAILAKKPERKQT